ncbi:MAG: dephospho-CoA kinase [Candidatus Omnitrophota bacterium]|jgi:dephospho-CoA kinase
MKKQKQRNKLVLGITGSFGSGKSTVARFFARWGAIIIDADKICHSLILPGSGIYDRMIRAFGPEMLGRNRKISRRKLAQKVFCDQEQLARLNRIIHPAAVKIIKQRIAAVKRGLVIVDAPLLIEAGLRSSVDKLIVVNIRKYSQLRRLLAKKNISKSQILKRISHQMPLKEKARLADFIIDNNGSLKNTRDQAILIGRKLWRN